MGGDAFQNDTVNRGGQAGAETVITLVGVGNRYRRDDAVGLIVSQQLKYKVPPGTRIVELDGDQSDLIELMRSTDVLIVVDAVKSTAPPGTVFRLDAVDDPLPREFMSSSTHSIDTLTAVELARALGALPERLIIYGIVGRDFSFSEGLSEEVRDAIDAAEERIIADIGTLREECSGHKKENRPSR